jgi:hypothetical protein
MTTREAVLFAVTAVGAVLFAAGLCTLLIWSDIRSYKVRKEWRESFMGLSFRIGDTVYTAIDYSQWNGNALCVSPDGKELRVSSEAVIRLHKESKP